MLPFKQINEGIVTSLLLVNYDLEWSEKSDLTTIENFCHHIRTKQANDSLCSRVIGADVPLH